MKNRTLQPSISNVNSSILLSFKNFLLTSGYGSGHKDLIKSQILAKKKKKKKIHETFFLTFTYITERRPRDFKKPKLASSGKPDRKMPLSTIEKFSGGISNSNPSPSLTASESSSPVNGGVLGLGGAGAWELQTAGPDEDIIDDGGGDSIITGRTSPSPPPPPKLSITIDFAPKILKEREREREREKKKCKRERKKKSTVK